MADLGELDADWPYFALDFPELTRDAAESISSKIEEDHPGLHVEIVDPADFWVAYMDKETVSLLAEALTLCLRSGTLSDQFGGESMLWHMRQWLDYATAQEKG